MSTCDTCKREIAPGETAWESEWTVIADDYRSARREIRYTCEDCETKRTQEATR